MEDKQGGHAPTDGLTRHIRLSARIISAASAVISHIVSLTERKDLYFTVFILLVLWYFMYFVCLTTVYDGSNGRNIQIICLLKSSKIIL